MPSTRGSSQPRDRIHVSDVFGTGRWFFTTSANWEAYMCVCVYIYIYICIKKYFWMQPVHRGQCPAWTLCSGAPQRRVAGYVLGLGRCTAPLVASQDHSRRNLREEVGSSKQVSTRWTPTVLQLPGPQGPFQRCSDVTPGSLLACL